MIKAVIFDVDGVLLDSFEANLDFFQRLFIKAGYSALTREQYLKDGFYRGMVDVIKDHVVNISDEELQRILNFWKSRQVVHNGALLSFPKDLDEVVKKLSENYLLAIATSRVKEGVFKPPRMAALKNLFSTTVAYEDTKNHKPHPEPLLVAAKKIHVEPDECIYIGDAPSDVIAAHAAGMKCVVYSKNKIGGADVQTDDFGEIPKLVLCLDKVK